MKNYVILLAGGIGKRMGSHIPKQFLSVKGKPIIAYSIENFQRCSLIEKIVIVCVKDWIDQLKKIVEDYNFTKVEWIVEGGSTSHDSIRNGIFFLKGKISDDDYVIVHDAVRPIISQDILGSLINTAYANGNAASSTVCHPPLVYTDDKKSGIKDIDREHVMLTASPQAFKYSLVLKCYEMAESDNRHDFTFTSSLLIHYGERVFFSKGSTHNIKITEKEDLELFEALLTISENK